MESVETFPRPLTFAQDHTHTHFHIPKRSLSPAEEKQALIRKIEAVTSANQILCERQQHLQGTIYDLRKLLSLVGRESAEETEYLHNKNKQLREKEERLSNGLKYAYKEGRHLQRCAQYWGQFLQQ